MTSDSKLRSFAPLSGGVVAEIQDREDPFAASRRDHAALTVSGAFCAFPSIASWAATSLATGILKALQLT